MLYCCVALTILEDVARTRLWCLLASSLSHSVRTPATLGNRLVLKYDNSQAFQCLLDFHNRISITKNSINQELAPMADASSWTHFRLFLTDEGSQRLGLWCRLESWFKFFL
jgi:hypothetical protein